ncbi:MAG: hypothetical protein WA220_02185 [Candidatus Nitrosopolaris sp.]
MCVGGTGSSSDHNSITITPEKTYDELHECKILALNVNPAKS